ncbi:MAG: hypothetical protein ACLFP4_14250 [Spirochaetales bacterium]
MGKNNKSMDEWWEERSLPQKILLGIGFAIAGLGFVAGIGLVFRLLWNWLMPEIFDLTTITYWQSLGLLAMAWIIFKPISFKDDESSKKQERRRKESLRQQMEPTPPTPPGTPDAPDATRLADGPGSPHDANGAGDSDGRLS